MMQLRRIPTFAVMLTALMALAGCATSSAVATGETLDVQLQVDNSLRDITGVSVYLLTDTGARRSLGPIESNRQGSYNRSLRAGTYQFMATRVGGDDILSERFRIDTNNLVVIWAIGQNQITFGER
jgi:hypothetical protein